MDTNLDALRADFAAAPTAPAAYHALVSALRGPATLAERVELHERWAETCTEPREVARALQQAGEGREALGEPGHALRHYMRVLELDPRDAVAARAFVRLSGEPRDLHRHVEWLGGWSARLREAGGSPPERAEVELALARAHAAIPGRLDRSLEHHRAAVALDPELEGTLDEAVARAQQARRIADARALLALAAETTRSPERRRALLRQLAEAQQAMPADFDGAIETLAALSQLTPDDVALLEERVTLLVQRARRKKGTAAERADLDAAASLEVELARRQRGEAALDAVTRALGHSPEHGPALALLAALVAESPSAEARARLGQHLEARVARGGAAASPDARLALLDWYEREGRPADAYDALAPLLLEAPTAAWLSRGLSLALAAGRLADAARLAQRLYAGAAQAAHERVALEDLLDRSLAAAEPSTTRRVATRLLELLPGHVGALEALSAVHAARGEHEALRGLLERRLGLTADPGERRALLRELVDLADGPLGDRELAADAFQKLAELDPRNPALRRQLLERLADVGRYRALAEVRRWEIASLETLAERKEALDALLALAQEHPFDHALLVAALRTYRAADPTDVDARASLVRLLRGAGELEEAALLLQESARAATETGPRLAALAELADLYDAGLRDDEAARRTTLQILELAPEDLRAIERLERLATRSERADWMVEALQHRARVAAHGELAEIHQRLGRLHDVPSGDPEAAMLAFEQVRALRSGDREAAAALLRLYEEHQRPERLAALLDELAGETSDPAARVELLKRRARLLLEVLDDADGAAACYRDVRALREDEEALSALLAHTRATSEHAELADLLATRLRMPISEEEALELGMERATLLLDYLGDPREAERDLLAIREREPTFAPALGRLGTLYLDEGDYARLAEVTEAHLELMTQPTQRAALARRLFGVYERDLPDAERALAAARRWVEAAPRDLEALRALAERLDPATDGRELVKALDARADELIRERARGEDDAETALRDEALRALEGSIVTAVEHLDDAAHAERRLVQALELGHDDQADVDHLTHLAATLDTKLGEDRLERAVATFLARKATAVERPHKERLFLAAAELFSGSLGDARLAFEVVKRAIVECGDDAQILRALVDYGRAGGFDDELDRVLAERFEASLDAKAARELQRERADLLYTLGRYSDAADAFHRLASLEPDNERAKVRHRECLVRAERYQDLLVTLGQALRRLGPDNVAMRVALLRDVARTWEGGLADRAEAMDAWKTVLAAAPGDAEASEALERLASPAAQRDSVATRSSGGTLLASSASIPPPPPPSRGSIPPPPPAPSEPLSVDGLELVDDGDEPDEDGKVV